jgi:hypothetical protein
VRDTLRFLFVSPELLVVLASCLGRLLVPHWFAMLGGLLSSADSLRTHLFISAPLAILTAGAGLSWKILFPLSENRKLIEWPDYGKLRARVRFGLTLLFVCTCVMVTVHLFASKIRSENLAFTSLASLSSMLAVLVTMFDAAIAVRALTEGLD